MLTFSGNVTVADGQVGNAVQGATSSLVVRPNARTTSGTLVAADTLSMGNLLDAVTFLRRNAVPTIDGAYNCYIDPVSSRQLFADNDFKLLFQGTATSSATFANGVVQRLPRHPLRADDGSAGAGASLDRQRLYPAARSCAARAR